MKDSELVEFCAEFRKGILGGNSSFSMCYAVCSPLASLLHITGVEVDLTEAHVRDVSGFSTNHYFLTLPDGRILDPTADQFESDLPAIYLGELPESYDIQNQQPGQ